MSWMEFVADDRVRFLDNSAAVKFIQRRQLTPDNLAGSVDHPIESFPVFLSGAAVPDSKGECQNTLNHCPIELHKQLLTDSETSQPSQEIQSLLPFLHEAVDVLFPLEVGGDQNAKKFKSVHDLNLRVVND